MEETKLKNKGYIYKVMNIITGQFYIGQRSSYKGSQEEDLGIHYFTSSKIVKPLFKNNTSEWKKEILYRDIQYSETLDDIEGYAIHKVINDKLCLNRSDPLVHPGFITAGRHQSEETKKKLAEANKGHKISEEGKKHISEAHKGHKGHKISEEGKKHISEAQKGKHKSDETRRKMSEAQKGKPSPLKGKPLSDETRRKMSMAKKGKPLSDEARRHMSEAHKGHKISEEAKKHISEATKKRALINIQEKKNENTRHLSYPR